MPRQQPSIRPFIVPMQEMAMKRLRMLPRTGPNTLMNAAVAPESHSS